MFNIKSFSTYYAALPPAPQIEALIEEQPGFRKEEIGDTMFTLRAFARNHATKRYITQFEGGFMADILIANRKLNRSVINKHVDDRIEELTANGVETTIDDRIRIYDEVTAALAPYMPVNYGTVRVIYMQKSGLLIVCSATKDAVSAAIDCMKSLFQEVAIYPVKLSGENYRLRMTAALTNYIEGGHTAFGEFFPGRNVRLKGEGADASVVTFSGIDINCNDDEFGVLNLLHSGSRVESIQLSYHDTHTFTILPGMAVKGIKTKLDDDELDPEEAQQNIQTLEEAYAESIAATMLLIENIVDHLMKLLLCTAPHIQIAPVLKTKESIEQEKADAEAQNSEETTNV